MTADLIKRLRDTPNWMRESYGSWKDCVLKYDRAPFEAADALERLTAELAEARRSVPHDELSRDGDGDIALDWRAPDGSMLSLSISDKGRASWAWLNGNENGHGSSWLHDQFHAILSKVLDAAIAAEQQKAGEKEA